LFKLVGEYSMKILIALLLLSVEANAARIKDIANIRGVRENQLVGYGLVVGLAGTGDGKAEFTSKSMVRMLETIGVKLDNKNVSSKNVAAVIITATLPPFARAGNKIDVTINAIGDATSLAGGTLVQTPLRAANGDVYAVSQGQILMGTDDGKGHMTVARIPSGAMIEKDVQSDFAARRMFRMTLSNPDFTTAVRMAKVLNQDLGGKYATANDSSTVDVIVPTQYHGNAVEFLALIESLDISPDMQAKVVVNEKTGTVIIGEKVKISKVAISHGSLTLSVGGETKKASGGKEAEGDRYFTLENSANVDDLVKALNKLGVKPKDLITILQSIKAAGALQAEIEIL
jgi:flagellar P-ring protein precursor FlgI